MSSFLGWLAEQEASRQAAGLTRTLRPRAATVGGGLLDLAGNDYLGLSGHPAVTEAVAQAARTWGAGATASRLVTGTTALHVELERALAAHAQQPGALVFSSGYLANLGVVTALGGRDALVVSDAHVHASLVDACRLSRSPVVVVPHQDVAAVERALAARTEPRALVLCESVYSVLGDVAPLAELAAVCSVHDAVLVVDEAHALGVAGADGRGLVAEASLAGRPEVVVTATLSKAFGSQGGAVLGHPAMLAHLVNTARSFIYDTGLAPPAAAGALAALRVLAREPERVDALRHAVRQLARAGDVDVPAGAVISVPMVSPQAALAAAELCAQAGLRVGCFRPPSVPDGVSRLRLTGRATLTGADLQQATTVLAACRRLSGAFALDLRDAGPVRAPR